MEQSRGPAVAKATGYFTPQATYLLSFYPLAVLTDCIFQHFAQMSDSGPCRHQK